MIYYRTHASRAGELPPELVGWSSPSADASLNEAIVGEHRVLAITPPFVFAPPANGWTKLCAGWEIAITGEFNPLHHCKMTSKWVCLPLEVDGVKWLMPVILNHAGSRGFKVVYGGTDFTPQLTADQVWALALAIEIRTCHDAGTVVDMPVKAKWAAQILGLTYCLSATTIGALNILSDDLIDKVLSVAGGYHADLN